MKHYIKPLSEFDNNKTTIYAPFDGTVYVDGSQPAFGIGERERAGEETLELMSPLDQHAVFIIWHIHFIAPLKNGDKVKAGQLLGYAVTSVTSKNYDFDFGVRYINQPNTISRFGNTFDSIFNHMTSEVLSEYEKFGLSKEAMFFSREFRESYPCTFNRGQSDDDWVFLKR